MTCELVAVFDAAVGSLVDDESEAEPSVVCINEASASILIGIAHDWVELGASVELRTHVMVVTSRVQPDGSGPSTVACCGKLYTIVALDALLGPLLVAVSVTVAESPGDIVVGPLTESTRSAIGPRVEYVADPELFAVFDSGPVAPVSVLEIVAATAFKVYDVPWVALGLETIGMEKATEAFTARPADDVHVTVDPLTAQRPPMSPPVPMVIPAGTVKVALIGPLASTEPSLETVSVAVADAPGAAGAGGVITALKSGRRSTTTVVAAAELLALVGSAEVADAVTVWATEVPFAADAVSGTSTTSEALTPRSPVTVQVRTVGFVPDGVHVAEPETIEAEPTVSPAGTVYTNCAPAALDGPWLSRVIRAVSD